MKKMYNKPELEIKEYNIDISIANIFSQINADWFNSNDEEIEWFDLLK